MKRIILASKSESVTIMCHQITAIKVSCRDEICVYTYGGVDVLFAMPAKDIVATTAAIDCFLSDESKTRMTIAVQGFGLNRI